VGLAPEGLAGEESDFEQELENNSKIDQTKIVNIDFKIIDIPSFFQF
jgi:hypothetical protein